jgi:two-component system chemotaxis sensor kinase CheA
MDHGIEAPEARVAAGKNPKGRITLEARNEGNEVWIVVSDDGKGLDRDKVYEKALERGLVRPGGPELTDEEVINFIFAAGFSTADKVTDVSGRGVGMDVVRRNLELINGRVDVKSVAGQGCRFTIRLPLTLTILEGMLVRVGDALYTVPNLMVREIIKTRPEQVTRNIDRQEIVRIRDGLYPVLRLHELHHLQPQCTGIDEGLLVVLEHQGAVFALLVDRLVGQHRAVIRPLPRRMSGVNGVSGCTILGNGEISLILDAGLLLGFAKSVAATAGAAGTLGGPFVPKEIARLGAAKAALPG